MKRIVYSSAAVAPLDDAAVARLVQAAQERNARHAITGVLLFNGKHFIQAIEGDDIDIDYLMSLILSDPRHHHVSVLSEEAIAAREFSDWSMQLVRFQSRDDIPHSFLQRLPQGARDALVTIA